MASLKRLALSFIAALACALPGGQPVSAQSDHPAFRDTAITEPAPGFDSPRRVLFQLSTDDERAINNVLWNAINIQKFYGMDNVEIAIVVFGPGMLAVYEDSSPVKERIQSLLKYGISFIGCGNTLEATQRSPDDLIDGVEWVQAGIPEIVERQLDGWVYVRP